MEVANRIGRRETKVLRVCSNCPLLLLVPRRLPTPSPSINELIEWCHRRVNGMVLDIGDLGEQLAWHCTPAGLYGLG